MHHLPSIAETPTSCTEDQFMCDNGLCIPNFYVCDGETDCSEDAISTDEMDCGEQAVVMYLNPEVVLPF